MKLVNGKEMLPAGITAMAPQESLPENDETYKHSHKMFSPLIYAQLNINDTHLSGQPSEIEFFLTKLQAYNQQGLVLSGEKTIDSRIQSVNERYSANVR